VITPLDAVNFAAAQLPVAPTLALAALGRDQVTAAGASVAAAFVARTGPDAARLAAAGTHSLDNPKFLDFLLFDQDGKIRPSLTGVFPDADHALLVATLKGNLSISQSSAAAGEDRLEGAA